MPVVDGFHQDAGSGIGTDVQKGGSGRSILNIQPEGEILRQDAGFLGKSRDPFVLNADPSKPDFRVPDLLPPTEIGEARLDRRKKLREVIEGTLKKDTLSGTWNRPDENRDGDFKLMHHPSFWSCHGSIS